MAHEVYQDTDTTYLYLATTATLESGQRDVRLDLLYSVPASPSLLRCSAAMNSDISVLTLLMPKPLLQNVDSLSANPPDMKAKPICELWAADNVEQAFRPFSW